MSLLDPNTQFVDLFSDMTFNEQGHPANLLDKHEMDQSNSHIYCLGRMPGGDLQPL